MTSLMSLFDTDVAEMDGIVVVLDQDMSCLELAETFP